MTACRADIRAHQAHPLVLLACGGDVVVERRTGHTRPDARRGGQNERGMRGVVGVRVYLAAGVPGVGTILVDRDYRGVPPVCQHRSRHAGHAGRRHQDTEGRQPLGRPEPSGHQLLDLIGQFRHTLRRAAIGQRHHAHDIDPVIRAGRDRVQQRHAVTVRITPPGRVPL
jgi:hypothetical protein